MGFKKTKYFTVFLLSLAAAGIANAALMASTSYQMETDVFAGGAAGSSASYDMNAISIGELIVGDASSANYSAYVGFLATGAETCNSRDDDQDGTLDEGCLAALPIVGGTQGTLSSRSCTYSCGRNEVCRSHTYATLFGGVCCATECVPKSESGYPDLALLSIGVSSFNPKPGDIIDFKLTIINRGSVASGPFPVSIFALPGDANSSASWVEIYKILGDSMEPRETKKYAVPVDTMKLLNMQCAGQLGNIFSLGVMLDSESMEEADEVNNWGSLSIIIGDRTATPELCCDDIDNDLDGLTDEGFTEVCGNLIDDDMDGLTDEGCSVICEDERGDYADDGAFPGEIECAVSPSPGTPLFKDIYGNGFCFNGCDKTLYIYPSGELAYEENLYGNMSYKHGKLSAKQLADFKNTVETGGFLSLDKDYYNCARAPTDAGSVTYTYSSGGTVKEVGFYAACPGGGDLRFPPALTELNAGLAQIKLLLKGGRAPGSTTTVNVFECETDADCINIKGQCCDIGW